MVLCRCKHCGKEFSVRNGSGNANKFCSRECYWNSKKNKITVECKNCRKKYEKIPSRKGCYCSRECLNEYKKKNNSIIATCIVCGKSVKKNRASVYSSGNIYCSRECSAKGHSIPGWRTSANRKMHSCISRGMRKSIGLNKAGRKWESLVGYTLPELVKHIESQFDSNMTWENYGLTGWHIDHIIPFTAFNFTKPEHPDFSRCWNLKNLRPMWAKDNIRKSNKLKKPFQPYLLLEAPQK